MGLGDEEKINVKGADVEPNCIRLEITCQGLQAGLQGRENLPARRSIRRRGRVWRKR